ncbi:MAG TPA: DUF2127 domain-containing protein [Candidatus Udaeobacter sp.]
MRSRAAVGVERTIEHTLFLVSVCSKGIVGLIETIAGLLLLVIPQAKLNAFVIFLTAPELAEDPTDRVATFLVHMVRELGADTKLFASAYLIVHGVIKIFLVAGLLRRRLWSYPVSLWFLAGFIAYQTYRFSLNYSLSMIVLSVVDLIVAFLIWREYQARKQGLA